MRVAYVGKYYEGNWIHFHDSFSNYCWATVEEIFRIPSVLNLGIGDRIYYYLEDDIDELDQNEFGVGIIEGEVTQLNGDSITVKSQLSNNQQVSHNCVIPLNFVSKSINDAIILPIEPPSWKKYCYYFNRTFLWIFNFFHFSRFINPTHWDHHSPRKNRKNFPAFDGESSNTGIYFYNGIFISFSLLTHRKMGRHQSR
jgi:hypothetical protein